MVSADRHACVVGAGLAGASVAASLCRRGWRVTLLSAGEAPADGASALPVGALSPHVTRSPTPLSVLTALGVPATLAELERLVPVGHGWQAAEILNLDHDPGLRPVALVRPGALVAAWVAEGRALGRLDVLAHTRVRALEAATDGWRLHRQGEGPPLHAAVVVLAAALGSLDLLAPLGGTWPLRPVQGQLSLGPQGGPPLAEHPLRHDGVFMPVYEDAGLPPRWPARVWTLGSTFRRGLTDTTVTEAAHHENLRRLQAMSPQAAARLGESLAAGRWLGWAGVRCASLDRLPLAGAVPDAAAPPVRGRALADLPRLPGLFTCCALGSRGLALSALLGQALAAQIDGDDPLLPRALSEAIDPARFGWREQRRARH